MHGCVRVTTIRTQPAMHKRGIERTRADTLRHAVHVHAQLAAGDSAGLLLVHRVPHATLHIMTRPLEKKKRMRRARETPTSPL